MRRILEALPLLRRSGDDDRGEAHTATREHAPPMTSGAPPNSLGSIVDGPLGHGR